MPLRVVFMGTPHFAVPALAEIVAAGHDIAAVYTQPPRPAGRGMDEQRSPIHLSAGSFGIPVCTPSSLKTEAEHEAFGRRGAEVAVVVAYGLILPKQFLEAPRAGCLNLHASALPRWRGAAPFQRAIMAGDTETAVTVMQMEEGLDTGPICLADDVPIGPNATAGDLHDHLARLGASLMVRALAALERGCLVAAPQASEGVTYAAKIGKTEARIDFTKTARNVHNQIRALSPCPGAWFAVGGEGKRERVKVLRSQLSAGSGLPGEVLHGAMTIACGEGAVRLVEVQRAGKKPMPVAEFLRGFPLLPGTRL